MSCVLQPRQWTLRGQFCVLLLSIIPFLLLGYWLRLPEYARERGRAEALKDHREGRLSRVRSIEFARDGYHPAGFSFFEFCEETTGLPIRQSRNFSRNPLCTAREQGYNAQVELLLQDPTVQRQYQPLAISRLAMFATLNDPTFEQVGLLPFHLSPTVKVQANSKGTVRIWNGGEQFELGPCRQVFVGELPEYPQLVFIRGDSSFCFAISKGGQEVCVVGGCRITRNGPY